MSNGAFKNNRTFLVTHDGQNENVQTKEKNVNRSA